MFLNPYTDSKTIRDLDLYVKDFNLIKAVEDALNRISRIGRAKDLLITGDGGSGKTSLLTYTRELAESKDIFCIYLFLGSMVREMETLEFFEWLEESIIDEVQVTYDIESFQKWERFRERFNSAGLSLGPLNIDLDLQSPSASRRFISRRLPGDYQKLAQEVLKKTKKKGILILLDDADEISASIFENFRTVFPDNGLYTLLVVSGRSLFMSGQEMTLDEYNKRLLRPFEHIHIHPFGQYQIKEVLERPLSKAPGNLWYDQKHIDIIFRISRGNPFIAYSIGELCFEHGLMGNQLRLTRYIVNLAEERIWGVAELMRRDQELHQIINNELEAR